MFDLPLRFQSGSGSWNLCLSSVFPKDSPFQELVRTHYGFSLIALWNIMSPSHPAKIEQPTTLIRNPPFQKVGETFARYYYDYATFLFLRNLISDTNKTLSDPNELDMFITGATEMTYTMHRSRVDRTDVATRARFSCNQVLTTFSSYLSSKDSGVASILDKAENTDLDSVASSLLTRIPLRPSNLSGLRRSQPYRRKPRAPTSARVQDIDTDNPFKYIECPSSRSPSGMNELEIFVVRCYESALKAVHATRQKFSATDTTCAVCVQIGDPFKDCEILQNVEFFRTHHIQYCLQG